jgi:photosystem II stability/assembly factor-like uncharacterized protein
MLKICLNLLVSLSFLQTATAQEIQMLAMGKTVSLRGLSVVSDQVIWVSGSDGTVGLSVDGGQSWKWTRVPGYELSDFRDIEAFSDQEAIIMGVTEPAVLMRTTDGGDKWTLVYKDTAKSAFWDAMDFSGQKGVLIGDPEKGKIFFASSSDSGRTWDKPMSPGLDGLDAGETFFAASGSNICYVSASQWALVSGGKKSCLYYAGNRYPLWLIQGGETTGANAIAVNPVNPNLAFVVGGDFSHDTLSQGNSIRIRFNPFSQEFPKSPPRGYRSCVEYLDESRMICCGARGVDVSKDGGMNWQNISDKSFHVCRKAKSGQAIFLAGAKGSVARLKWE